MQAWRIPAAVLMATIFLGLQIPAHEYGHCLSFWARGGDMCYVRFAAPGHTLPSGDGAAVGAIGQAFVGEAPWWEHPVIYGLHFAVTCAFGFWLGNWIGRPGRQRTTSLLDVDAPMRATVRSRISGLARLVGQRL